MKRLIFLIFFLAAITGVQMKGQTEKITAAMNLFGEIKTLLAEDNGQLWGINLYGALMFVDTSTKNFVANEQNNNKTLIENGGLFTGKLDDKIIVGNTSLAIDGKNWTMVLLPLPEDIDSRRALIVHELFHSIQGRLNLKPDAGTNSHLDNKTARIYMRLEWNALLKAYTENDESKCIDHIMNALLFRELRRFEYPGAAVKEDCLELQEGLAEYTGVRLGIAEKNKMEKYVSEKVGNAVKFYPSFIRSFAYVSGPLYGLLLDKSGKEWRKELNPGSDLGKLLADKYSLKTESDLKSIFDSRKDEYGFKEIKEFEDKRVEPNSKVLDKYKKVFINSPVLSLPNKKMQFQFNPNELVSLGDAGDVYPHIKVVDKWGILTAEEGALIAADWMSVLVSAPTKTDGNILTGNGWKLVLNEKWKVVQKGSSFVLEEIK